MSAPTSSTATDLQNAWRLVPIPVMLALGLGVLLLGVVFHAEAAAAVAVGTSPPPQPFATSCCRSPPTCVGAAPRVGRGEESNR